MASSSPSSLSAIQGLWLVVLTALVSYLFYIVMVQQKREIDLLQKQVQLHHNLWKQWVDYESKRKGQVNVRSSRHVQTQQEVGEEYLQIDFWREYVQRALPPGCEDSEFHRQWLLEMDSYFWNRISQEKNHVYLNCDLIEKEGLCEQYSQFLEKKLPQFNFTILNESKLITKSQMVLKVVDNSEKLKELTKADESVQHLDKIVAFIGDCNPDHSNPNNPWLIVKFAIVNNSIVTCDDVSLSALSNFVWKKGVE
ncbi:predicted protein [Naegleria gruberi]|uniref:Predicted protein n=1 Tax=Naegleria gruberi TaxID=5762 RepID=D2VBL4_NAEGR|nr:uncharacterized protein NAEGRDRAFT_66257 [Naegleria gruberi]EFC45929.1 predicted protein [Naegleria gruberi]|eukprot:XP_002678673.1 predicted protein [Naegleria gruberi strain NEG-M]